MTGGISSYLVGDSGVLLTFDAGPSVRIADVADGALYVEPTASPRTDWRFDSWGHHQMMNMSSQND